MNAYKHRGCRCEACRKTYSDYQRAYRQSRPERVAAYKRAYYRKHREAVLEKCRNYRAQNPDKIRDWHASNRERVAARVRLTRYGLTGAAYAALLRKQGGACAICGRGFGDGSPHVDHDHACCPGIKSCGGCVRGLLCGDCNRGLGLFGDNPERLRAASRYLGRSR